MGADEKTRGEKMNIDFLEKDQIWNDEKTNYWFSVDGVEWAISEQNGELALLDSNSCPVEPCNDHDGIMDALFPLYQEHIND